MQETISGSGARPATVRTLSGAACGLWLVAMVLFTATWVVLGAVNDGYVLFDAVIEDYSPIHQPISGLGLGSTATAMNTAFVLYGLIAVAGAWGASRLVAVIDPGTRMATLIPLALHGLGSVMVGIFTLESMDLHSVGFLLILAPVVSFVLVGRRFSRLADVRTAGRALLWIAAPVSALLIAAFFASFDPVAAGDGGGVAGLVQRALVLNLQIGIAVLITVSRPAGSRPPLTSDHGLSSCGGCHVRDTSDARAVGAAERVRPAGPAARLGPRP